jgi:bifunctional N-acetylglucosamine-1-phosphate-uridyltransferase/glucosamine-1-phosphate-acetyltransferase GlmU-like protein
VFRPDALLSSLKQLTANNVQGEYYLTDCPGVLKADGQRVDALCVLQPIETLSINTKEELAVVESEIKKLSTKKAAKASGSSGRLGTKTAKAAKPKSGIRKKSK